MIRTALKLALLAAVANATWHVFTVYSANYKFQDAVEYAAQYRGAKTDEQLAEQVIDMAAQAELPIDPDQLSVSHAETHTVIDTSYVRVVELFPGVKYPWPMKVHVDAYTTAPPVMLHDLSRPQ